MGWLNKLADQRIRAQQRHEPPPARGGVRAKGAGKAVDTAALEAAGVSDKILKKFAAALQPAAGELAELTQLTLGMRAHHATQFGHALDRFYSELGKFVGNLPDDARGAAAKLSVKALKSVVEQAGGVERAIGGLEVLSSLLFHQGPGKEAFAPRAKVAEAEVVTLLDSLRGRENASSLLLGYRNLIEGAVMRSDHVPLASRQAIWGGARAFLLTSSPAHGIAQGELGGLVGLFFETLAAKPDPLKAFVAAHARALEPHAGAQKAAKAQLKIQPQLEPGAPGTVAFDAMTAALDKLLDAHPVGPASLLETVESLVGKLHARAPAIAQDEAKGYQTIAQMITHVAGGASAELVLRTLNEVLVDLAANPAAMAAMGKIAKADDVPRALLASRAVQLGRPLDGMERGLERLARLPADLANATAIAILPHVAFPHVGHTLLATAQFAREADSIEEIARFARLHAHGYTAIVQQVGEEHAAPLTAAFAGQLDEARNAQVAGMMGAQMMAHLPGVALAKLAVGVRAGESGVLAVDQQNPQGRQPMQYITRLMPSVNQPALNEDAKAALARRAIHVGTELARLDRDPEGVMARVVDDWTFAIQHPDQLNSAQKAQKPLGLRGGNASAISFLEAHAELPMELAFTAGRHLNKEQITWLCGAIAEQRSHGKIRQLRDLVFALVEAGRLDVLDGFRDPKLSGGAREAALVHIVQEYRVGRLAQLPFDRIRDGFAAGGDPVGELRAEQNAAALGAILPGGKVKQLDPDAMAELRRNEAAVKSFVAFFPDGGQTWNLPAETFKAPLVDWLQSFAAGDIQAYKYGNPVSAQQLARLSPAAREIWSTEGITAKAQAQAADVPELQGAAPLLKGLAEALAKVKLATKQEPDLAMDAATEQKLSARRDVLVTGLRDAKKGSAAHRKASGELGPINRKLALVELKLALDAWVAGGAGSATEGLVKVKGLLPPAASALRALGATGMTETISDLSFLASKIKSSPRQGLYAADEDRLDAYMTSFGGGSCIDPEHGFNRPNIVEKMASGRYKMCRAMDGERPQARSFVRLMDIEVGNYKGYGLWLDAPAATPNGNASAEAQQLMYQHMLDKAMAMGVPFFCSGGYVQQACDARGLQNQAMNVAVLLDHGHTGNHHTEKLGPIAPYGVKWEPSTWEYGYQSAAAGAPFHRMEGQVNIVFPPGVQP